MNKIQYDMIFEEYIICSVKYLKSYQYTQALKLIHEAMLIDDTSAVVHNLLGIYYEMNGDYEHARKLYLAASSLDPSFRPSINNLNRITSYTTERNIELIDFGCKGVTKKLRFKHLY